MSLWLVRVLIPDIYNVIVTSQSSYSRYIYNLIVTSPEFLFQISITSLWLVRILIPDISNVIVTNQIS